MASNLDMKQLFGLLVIISLAISCSCQKQLTEAEIQALIEREVKRQLAAEHEAEEKELERRRAEFNARKNALLGRKAAPGSASAAGVPQAAEGVSPTPTPAAAGGTAQ
jgi:hypothetical protein